MRELAAMPECDLYRDEDELTTLIVEEEPTVVNEDDSLPQSVEKITRKKMHGYMLLDPWKIGKEKLKKMDVLYTRGEKARRLEKKSRICKCILNGIKDMIEQQSNIVIDEERSELNNWQHHTRFRQNNLDL